MSLELDTLLIFSNKCPAAGADCIEAGEDCTTDQKCCNEGGDPTDCPAVNKCPAASADCIEAGQDCK